MPCRYLLVAYYGNMAATDTNQRTSNAPTSSSANDLSTSRELSPVPQDDESFSLAHADSENMATKSAFLITSVSHLPDETEEGDTHHGATVSKDADEIKQEISITNSNRFSSSSSVGEPDDISLLTNTEPSLQDDHPLFSKSVIINESVSANPSPKPPEVAMSHMSATQLAPSRFRRVNQYVRGRWLVRDAFEPEERPESEAKMTSKIEGQPIVLSPSISRKQANEIINELNHQHQQSSLTISDVESAIGQNDKSSESIHSLSRTASMSSMVKSVTDEEERELGPQEDTESMASAPITTQTPDIPSNTVINTTVLTHHQLCPCEECSLGVSQGRTIEECQHTLHSAMIHLQNQMSLYIHCVSSLKIVSDENRKITKENLELKERIKRLESELERLHTEQGGIPEPSSS